MNEAVAAKRGGALARLSPATEAALASAEAGDSFRHGLAAAVVAEARAALAATPVVPAGPRALFAWIRPAIPGVRNPPSREGAEAFALTLAAVCCDLPETVWTSDALKAGLRVWQFWPSVADVRTVVTRQAGALLARRRALAAVAAARVAEPARPVVPPSPAERAAVAAVVAGYRAEVVAHLAPRRRPPPATPLTPAQLAAVRAGGRPGERLA